MRLGSPADLRRRFRTGRPCLDLVHTGGEGVLARWELVHEPADMGRLFGLILGLPAVAADGSDLAAMRPLRAAVTRIAYGLATGADPAATPPHPVADRVAQVLAGIGRPGPADIAVINAAAAAPPLVPALHPDGTSTVVGPTAAAALSTLARDAVDLFGGPLARRVRICAADDCGLLFVDASRPGRRRWCSMERCGTREKVRRHRAGS